jgi:CHAT domain-containing protein
MQKRRLTLALVIAFVLAMTLLLAYSLEHRWWPAAEQPLTNYSYLAHPSPALLRADNLKHQRYFGAARDSYQKLLDGKLPRAEHIYVLNQLIFILVSQGQEQAATRRLAELDSLAGGDWSDEVAGARADYRLNLGIRTFYAGESADSLFREALVDYRKVFNGDDVHLAQCYVWLGLATLKGDPSDEHDYMFRANEAYLQHQDWQLGRPEYHWGMAQFRQLQRAYESGLTHCAAGLRMLRKDTLGNGRLQTSLRNLQAAMLMKLNRCDSALLALDTALQLGRGHGPAVHLETLRQIALCRIKIDTSEHRVMEAIARLDTAEAELGKPYKITDWLKGVYYYKKGWWRRCIYYHQLFLNGARAEKYLLREKDNSLYMLSTACAAIGRYDLAARYALLNLELGNDQQLAVQRGGLLYPRSDMAAEYDLTVLSVLGQLSLKQYEQAGDPRHLEQAAIWFNGAEAIYDSKITDKDEEALLQMQQEFIDPCNLAALEMAYLQYRRTGEQSWLDKALQYGERRHSNIMFREILQAQAGGSSSLRALQKRLGELETEYKRLKYKEEDGSALLFDEQTRRDSLYDAMFALKQQIAEKLTPYRLSAQLTDSTITAVRARLRPGEAMVQFNLAEVYIYSLYVDADTCVFKRQRGRAALRDKVARFRALLTTATSTPAEFVPVATELYRQLLAPFDQRLLNGTINQLLVIPDAELNSLPFEALLRSNDLAPNAAPRFHTLPYLLRDYAVLYSPSWKVHRANEGRSYRPPVRLNIGVWIDTTFQSWKKGLGAMYEIWDSSSVEHSRPCTEQNFIENFQRFNTLHFMLHGYSSREKTHGYRLLFRNGPAIDSLHGGEIRRLDFRAATLVVLAVCEAAVGREQPGEGTASLSRSFMQRGVPWVISTLDKVDEEATQRILTAFYREYHRKPDIPQALRQAKLAYIGQPRQGSWWHPHYWTALVVQH